MKVKDVHLSQRQHESIGFYFYSVTIVDSSLYNDNKIKGINKAK